MAAKMMTSIPKHIITIILTQAAEVDRQGICVRWCA